MKTLSPAQEVQFMVVRNAYAAEGEEITVEDYLHALEMVRATQGVELPTDFQVIDEIERLIQIGLEDLDEQAIEDGEF